MQAVIVTDPHLVSEILAPGAEVEKSIDLVYSHFNVVSPSLDSILSWTQH